MNDQPFSNALHQATRLDAIPGRFDPWLLGVAIALACFGVVMVASSSIAIGEGLHVGPFYFLTRHVMFLAAGIGLALWLMRTELKSIEQHGQWLLLACFVLLLLVFVPGIGKTVIGALALGAALGTVAVIVRQEIILLVMGGIFVIETLSVMIQVASFKLTGKRVFRMAPIHHHFELKGWPEPRVIVRFWIISVVLVLVGLATLKVR